MHELTRGGGSEIFGSQESETEKANNLGKLCRQV